MSDVQNSAEQACVELEATVTRELEALRARATAAESQANQLRLALATSQEETAKARAHAARFRHELTESAETLLLASTALMTAARSRDRIAALAASWQALLTVLATLTPPLKMTAADALEQCILDLKAATDCDCKACKPQPDTKAEPPDLASALGVTDALAYALGMRDGAKDGPRDAVDSALFTLLEDALRASKDGPRG
jgi:hypothetical protein